MQWTRFVGLFTAVSLVSLTGVADPIVIPTSPAHRPLLKSIYSEVHDVKEFFRRDTKAVVFAFIGIQCPVSQQYVPRLTAIHDQFKSQHVQLLGIYPDASVNVLEMARHAHEQDLPFPVLQDVDQRLARLLEVTTIPQVVVIDRQFDRRFQGPIDNQFKKRGHLPEPTQHHLVEALEQILAGQSVTNPVVPASGCPIESHVAKSSPPKLSFYRDIQPIAQRHCAGCHHQNGAGPFDLITFEDFGNNLEKIREVVVDRRMPPWHGFLNPQFGKLLNDKQLSGEEVRTLVSWIDSGAAEGDRADAAPLRQWPAADAWGIGKPDFVYEIDPPFQVPKSGVVEYQFFRVKLDFPADRWFQAIEIKPGNAGVVHHITLHLVDAESRTFSSILGMATLYGLNTQRARLLNDYLPGDTYNAKTYLPGQAIRIPKHMDLIFEIHYTPNNRQAVTDRSKVGFKWASSPPEDEVLTTVFRRPVGGFRIPPFDPHYRMEDTYYFERDVEIDTIRPHFHLRGKSYRLEIIERDATERIVKRTPILSVPAYDFRWQRTYELATPLRVLAGTELLAIGHFDNSEFNPNNPDPSVTVVWGEGTSDEMFSTRFKYRIARPLGNEGLRVGDALSDTSVGRQ